MPRRPKKPFLVAGLLFLGIAYVSFRITYEESKWLLDTIQDPPKPGDQYWVDSACGTFLFWCSSLTGLAASVGALVSIALIILIRS